MTKYLKIILIIVAMLLSFWSGIQWKTFWYNDKCLDLGGGSNPGNYPICVIEK